VLDLLRYQPEQVVNPTLVLADFTQQQSKNQSYDLNAFTSRIASHYTREIVAGLIKIVVEANQHKLIKAMEGTC
jgi:hypothetical protein